MRDATIIAQWTKGRFFTMNRQNNAVAYVIVIFCLLLFGTACGSERNGDETNKTPETSLKDTGKKEPQADQEKATNTDSKTLETPLRDIGKKEPQTREEQAERVCHQAKELEGLGQVISTDLKDSCKSLGYW
jgi:hypothetical protein